MNLIHFADFPSVGLQVPSHSGCIEEAAASHEGEAMCAEGMEESENNQAVCL